MGPMDMFKFEDDESLMFSPGDLSSMINEEIAKEVILSTEEEDQIIEAKRLIDQYTKEYKEKLELYRAVLTRQPGVEVTVGLRNIATGKERIATPLEIKALCETSRKNVFQYATFLAGKASRLQKTGYLERAKKEFKIAYDALSEVYGTFHEKTVGIASDYAGVLIRAGIQSEVAQGQALLQQIVDKLAAKLSEADCSQNIKKVIAIADLILAQCCLSTDPDRALIHIDRSEKLRQEYNDLPAGIDRVRYMRATLEYFKGNLKNAKKLFSECYKFRTTLGEYNCELLPPLKYLIDIAAQDRKTDEEVVYLKKQRDIKVHLGHPEREVINIELKIIQSMVLETDEEEWWNVIESVEDRLNKIPVTTESADIGLNYYTLAETRINTLLPHAWPIDKKVKYYADTLALLHKASGHLNQNQDVKSNLSEKIKYTIEMCIMKKDFFSDPNLYLFEDEVDDENENMRKLKEELKNLSEFSSEVRHSLVDAQDRILTVEEFKELPLKGTINPFKLRTAQGGINSEFRDGKSLEQTKQVLVDNPQYTAQIPPVQIGIYNNKVYSFDTRRLIVHQQAREQNSNVNIRYEKISGSYLEDRIKAIFSPRSWNGHVTAIRYGGKNSESIAYINPAYRAQLAETVNKGFVRWPAERQAAHADANGFCINKAKAKKIYLFLCKKRDEGSKVAKKLIDEAMDINNKQGRDAFYEHLTCKKFEMDLAGDDPRLEAKSNSSRERSLTL